MTWAPALRVEDIAPTTTEVEANRAMRRAVSSRRSVKGQDEQRQALEERVRAAGWGEWLDARGVRERVDKATGEIVSEAPVIPRSVLACLADAWTFVQVGDAMELRPFRCKSWRCPRCSPYVTRELCGVLTDTFLGTAAELEEHGPRIPASECVFLTVTEDRARHRNAFAAAKSCGDRFRELLKRVREDAARALGRPVEEAKRASCKAVQVWEQHARADRDGRGQFLHVHAVVWCPDLAKMVRRAGTVDFAGREAWAYGGRIVNLGRRGRSGRARHLGFGLVDVQPLEDAEGIAAYLAKLKWLTAEVGGTSGKAHQIPTCAPKRFRRLRASLGFLVRRRPPSIGPRLPVARTWTSAGLAQGPRPIVQAVIDLFRSLGRSPVADDVAHAVGLALYEGAERVRTWILEHLEPEST